MPSDFKVYKVTYILIFLNLLFYLISVILSFSLEAIDLEVLVVLGALYGPLVLLQDQWWRLLAAMFLHGGMMHILMNVFSLYIIGRMVELYFDRRSYLLLYFSSGLIAGLASLWMHPHSVGVGASGAIFGTFGALAAFFIVFRERIATQAKAFMRSFGLILLINLVLGLAIPSIDMSAHIAGLITGVVIGIVLLKYRNYFWFIAGFCVVLFSLGVVMLRQIYLG